MALQITKKLQNGLVAPDAYHRIDTVSGHSGSLIISVNCYASREMYEQGAPYLEQDLYTFAPDTSSNAKEVFTQGYEFLKNLPEFAEASDVLE